MSPMLYDVHTGRPCFAQGNGSFDDEDHPYGVPYPIADANADKALYRGAGSFWLPTGYPEVGVQTTHRATVLYETSGSPNGIPASDQTESVHRQTSIDWVCGLTTPRSGNGDVAPYSSGGVCRCYFRDWTNPNVYPYYSIGLFNFHYCLNGYNTNFAKWAAQSCAGCEITHIRVEALKGTDSNTQDLDATHTLRFVPRWITLPYDDDELADLPWRPNDLDALDGFSLTAYGDTTVDVTALTLTQQAGKYLVLIAYHPFIMPDHWLYGSTSQQFVSNVTPVSYKLKVPD